ncbi:MAG: Crp/Fnr family transcriptional regulator [Deltaproteobacteria bacterium]|nr:Crp/Fnr family transcriptional regulator [Deltaproteobacteria bacterium]
MDEKTNIISSSLLFQGLAEDQLKEIAEISIEKRFDKGRLIFNEEDDGNGFYLISEGQVKVFKLSSDGKEQILHIFGPGDPFGEVPVFSGQKFPANAAAIEKVSLLFFPRKTFIKLISSRPNLALNMLAVLSKRLRQFATQVENLSLKEVPSRLAHYLIYLIEDQGNSDIVMLGISKGQLASLLGTIPETLSRIFARMNNQGLIEVKDRNIRILNQNGLRELAETGKRE